MQLLKKLFIEKLGVLSVEFDRLLRINIVSVFYREYNPQMYICCETLHYITI